MPEGRIIVADQDGTHVIKFIGDIRLTLCPALDQYLDSIFNRSTFKTILIDLTGAQGIDSTTLGMLAKMSIRMKKKMGFVPTLVSINPNITRVIMSMGFEKVFLMAAPHSSNRLTSACGSKPRGSGVSPMIKVELCPTEL